MKINVLWIVIFYTALDRTNIIGTYNWQIKTGPKLDYSLYNVYQSNENFRGSTQNTLIFSNQFSEDRFRNWFKAAN